MKMKKLFIVAIISLMGVSVFAQFGVKAGLNLANIKSTTMGEDDEFDMLPAFHIGGFYKMELSDALFLEPSLLLSQKGAKSDIGDNEVKTKITYLEVPVVAGYKINNFFVNMGPYFGFALSGKVKPEEGDDIDIEIGSDKEDDLKAMNMGLMIGAGMEFNKITVGLNYQLGLSNNDPNGDSDNVLKDRNIMLSVGYAF